MANREKIRSLKRYRQIAQEIDRLIEELERWNDWAIRITSSCSDIPKGGGGDHIQNAVERILDLEEQIDHKIDQMIGIKAEIEADIGTVSEDHLKTLLRYRYINGYTWEQVAVKMHYSYMHVCRLHRKALEQLKML